MEQQSLGDFVRTTREAFGHWFTRRELARRAEISPSTVGRVETEAHIPEPQTIERIADALGVPRDALLGLAGYAALRADEEAALAAATAALEAVPVVPPVALPAWATVRAQLGHWATIRQAADLGALRALVLALVDRVTPRPAGRGRVTVEVEWSALGEALGALSFGGKTPKRQPR